MGTGVRPVINDSPKPTCDYLILDWSEVRLYHTRVILLSFLGFLVLSLLLGTVHNHFALPLNIVLLLIINIGVGLSLTKWFHTLGQGSKSFLQLLDSSKLDEKWTLRKEHISLEELSRVFEKMHNCLDASGSHGTDDLTDLAWFVVLVWSLFSVATVQLFNQPSLVSASGTLIIASLCFLLYINGYQSINSARYADEVGHLEYYAKSRIEPLLKGERSNGAKMFIEWLEKGNQKVLREIGLLLRITDAASEPLILKYFLGLPSEESERFELNLSENRQSFKDRLQVIVISFGEKGWHLTDNKSCITIFNAKSNLQINKPLTYVQTPSTISKSASVVKALLDQIMGSHR